MSTIISAVYFSHAVIHHGKTFRADHVTQFRTAHERSSLDRELRENGQTRIMKVCYGLVTDVEGAIYFVTVPVVGACILSMRLFHNLDPSFLIANSIPIVSTPFLSRYFHPYLHLPIDEAAEVAPRVIGWLLRTRFGKWARMSHFVHHRHARYNFNLLPGGEYLLRTYRTPTEQETAEMRNIGLIKGDH